MVEAHPLSLETIKEPRQHPSRERKPAEECAHLRLRALHDLEQPLLFARGEKLDLPHLPHVHPHRIFRRRLDGRGARAAGFAPRAFGLLLADDPHAVHLELAQHALRQDGIYHFLRHHAVELIEGDASAVQRAEALHLADRIAQGHVLKRRELRILLRRRLRLALSVLMCRGILLRRRLVRHSHFPYLFIYPLLHLHTAPFKYSNFGKAHALWTTASAIPSRAFRTTRGRGEWRRECRAQSPPA